MPPKSAMRGSQDSRMKEIAVVLISSLAVLFSTVFVVDMLGRAWDAEGFFRRLSMTIGEALGGDVDVVIVASAGILIAWIVLFAIDESMRVQRLVIAAFSVLFAVEIVRSGRWTDLVNWSSNLSWLVAGLLFGLTTGGFLSYLFTNRRRFPRTGKLIYLTVIGAVVVGYSQLLIAGTASTGTVDALSSLTLIYSLAVYIKYDDRKNVVVVASNEETRTVVLGGVFQYVRDRHEGVPLQGGRLLNNALTEIEGKYEIQTQITKPIEFRYKYGTGLISRWISVSAENYRLSDVNRRVIDRVNRKIGGSSDLVRWLYRRLVLPVDLLRPDFLSVSTSRVARMSQKISEADVVVVPLSVSDMNENTNTDVISELNEICKRSASTKLVVVATDAEEAVEMRDEDYGVRPMFGDSKHKKYISIDLLGCQTCTVVPVSTAEETDHTSLEGIPNLVKEIGS
jgi:hypothetical protein